MLCFKRNKHYTLSASFVPVSVTALVPTANSSHLSLPLRGAGLSGEEVPGSRRPWHQEINDRPRRSGHTQGACAPPGSEDAPGGREGESPSLLWGFPCHTRAPLPAGKEGQTDLPSFLLVLPSSGPSSPAPPSLTHFPPSGSSSNTAGPPCSWLWRLLFPLPGQRFHFLSFDIYFY